MKTCDEIRLENLRALITEAGGVDQLAARYGCTPPYIKQMSRGYKDSRSGSPKGIGDQAARMLERSMNKERGWMDHDHTPIDMAAQNCAPYVVTPNESEAILISAFRSASDAQRGIALAWAKANLAG